MTAARETIDEARRRLASPDWRRQEREGHAVGILLLVLASLLGAGLVAAVTVVESLTTLAGIPTWGWLAVGGRVLLASGGRSATSPVEVGRRLDVVGQRFSCMTLPG